MCAVQRPKGAILTAMLALAAVLIDAALTIYGLPGHVPERHCSK